MKIKENMKTMVFHIVEKHQSRGRRRRWAVKIEDV